MKLQCSLLACIVRVLRVTDEDSLFKIAEYDPRSLSLSVIIAFKGTNFYIFIVVLHIYSKILGNRLAAQKQKFDPYQISSSIYLLPVVNVLARQLQNM